jgi:hypothetical protein
MKRKCLLSYVITVVATYMIILCSLGLFIVCTEPFRYGTDEGRDDQDQSFGIDKMAAALAM